MSTSAASHTLAFLDARHRATPGARRVLTRDEALALADTVLGFSKLPLPGLRLQHRVITTVRITRNHHVACVEHDLLSLNFPTKIGSDIRVSIGTNVRDLAMLRRVMEHAQTCATPLPLPTADDTPDPVEAPKVRSYLPVALWRDGTQHAMDILNGDTVANLVRPLQQSSLLCAATILLMTRVVLHRPVGGQAVWGEETDSEVTVSARTPDGKASGWSGQAHRDFTRIDPARVAHDAIEMAQRMRGAVRVEPGRYTTILGPAAVGALVSALEFAFDAEGLGPFAAGPPTRIGHRVLDPRITLTTDPMDPEGGEFPFFDDGYAAYPSGKATWVEQGILRQLGYGSPYAALNAGKFPIKAPAALHMSGGPTSIEEMIAQCERGLYVHRLSGVDVVDPASASMTGTTRDGCFLIKQGKIATPVTNLRFYQSPALAFNRVLALGAPERASFGLTPPSLGNRDTWGTWPHAPIIVPPMMVEDFNFSSMTDAV